MKKMEDFSRAFRGDENLLTASLFCNSSSNLILKLISFFLNFSDMATSILSPPTNLEGLASA